VPPEAARVDE
jgi:hypothetical protein